MQVNVFVASKASGEPPTILVLPFGPTAVIPRHLLALDWRHLAVTMTDDRLIGAPAVDVEAAIGQHGYALLSPPTARLG